MNSKKWSLSLRHWAIIIISAILITMVTVQYVLNFSFIKYLQARFSEKTMQLIVSNINTMMLFPLATGDRSEISRIVEDLIQLDEVYAIEIRSSDGELIYRGENDTVPINRGIPIFKKVIAIVDTTPPVDRPLFQGNNITNNDPLGTARIYLTTAKLDSELSEEIYIRLVLFIAVVIFLVFVIFLLSRSTQRYVTRLQKSMDNVASGKYDTLPPNWRITEWNQIAEGLNRLSKSLEISFQAIKDSKLKTSQALMQAEQADKFKSDFVRIFAHEIRTPANTISSLIDVIYHKLVDAPVNPILKNHFDICYTASQELNSVIDELMDFSQYESENYHLTLNPISFSPVDLFSEVQENNKPVFEQKNLNFIVQETFINNGLSADSIVITDKNKLLRVISNLVKNAYKYTTQGTVSIEWHIKTTQSTPTLWFEVADTGIGIPEDKIDHIFDQFYQINSLAKPPGGWGLGLTIVKRFVEALGGNINVDSKIGSGTTFTVSIPVEIENLNDQLIDRSTSHSSFNLYAMIIDDNPSNCYALEQVLSGIGIDSNYETDPNIALNEIAKTAFDLIIVDYHLPGTDGISMIKNIRKSKLNEYSAIICITADTHVKTQESIGSINIDGFLTKPINNRELYDLIRNIYYAKNVTKNVIKKLK